MERRKKVALEVLEYINLNPNASRERILKEYTEIKNEHELTGDLKLSEILAAKGVV